jgi:hypothetical protein
MILDAIFEKLWLLDWFALFLGLGSADHLAKVGLKIKSILDSVILVLV